MPQPSSEKLQCIKYGKNMTSWTRLRIDLVQRWSNWESTRKKQTLKVSLLRWASGNCKCLNKNSQMPKNAMNSWPNKLKTTSRFSTRIFCNSNQKFWSQSKSPSSLGPNQFLRNKSQDSERRKTILLSRQMSCLIWGFANILKARLEMPKGIKLMQFVNFWLKLMFL